MSRAFGRSTKLALIITLAPAVTDGQCHGKGLSKTTYAGSADAQFAALDFMVKVLGMTPADDSAPGNAQQCPAGTSGAEEPWFITMQRGETLAAGYTVGTCTLFYGPTQTVPAALASSGEGAERGGGESDASADDDGPAFDAGSWAGPSALWRPLMAGLDCTYSYSPDANALAPFNDDSLADDADAADYDSLASTAAAAAATATVFVAGRSNAILAPVVVAARSPDTCCKACAADRRCFAAAFLPHMPPTSAASSPTALSSGHTSMTAGPPPLSFASTGLLTFPPRHHGPGPQPGECFGLHVTSVPGHSDAPGLRVEAVEEHFNAKLAGMKTFDLFLDYNVAFYTPSLDALLTRLDNQHVPWLAAQWPVPADPKDRNAGTAADAAVAALASGPLPTSFHQGSSHTRNGVSSSSRSSSSRSSGNRSRSRSSGGERTTTTAYPSVAPSALPSEAPSGLPTEAPTEMAESHEYENDGDSNDLGASAAEGALHMSTTRPAGGYSVFVHVTGTQLVIEFLAVSSCRLTRAANVTADSPLAWRSAGNPLGVLLPLEPRMTHAAWQEHVLWPVAAANNSNSGSSSESSSESSSRSISGSCSDNGISTSGGGGLGGVGPLFGLAAVSVSRAASSRALLAATERFYVEGAGCATTMAINAWKATAVLNPTAAAAVAPSLALWKRCFRWPGSQADVCFTTYEAAEADDGEAAAESAHRETDETADIEASPKAASLLTLGTFTPAAFEAMLASSHERWLRNKPACGMDRWEDNHYAVDLGPNEFPAAMSSADSTFAKPPPPSKWASPAVQAEGAAVAAGFSTDDGANSSSNESGNDASSTAAEGATEGRRKTTEPVLEAGANEEEITEKKEENEEKHAKAGSVAGYDVGPLLAFVVAEGGLYTCGGGPHGNPTEGVHYLFDPTGWGVQLDVSMAHARTMPGCEDPHQAGDNAASPGPSAWCRGSRSACAWEESGPEQLLSAAHTDTNAAPVLADAHAAASKPGPAPAPHAPYPTWPSEVLNALTTVAAAAIATPDEETGAGAATEAAIEEKAGAAAWSWESYWRTAQASGTTVLKGALLLCVGAVFAVLAHECRDSGGGLMGPKFTRQSRRGTYELVAQQQPTKEPRRPMLHPCPQASQKDSARANLLASGDDDLDGDYDEEDGGI